MAFDPVICERLNQSYFKTMGKMYEHFDLDIGMTLI